ncbi:MAG TPA: FAD-binding and (Fe-S)-binding domain-containing protein [Candidatus Dormibacteraeota bacterium]|jgi:FAD/FMN-containing dehydrogenase/Fe-S oxidoreductase|nr:FAD-binding and (Fe-S)-binding domain-containing protein [Candidatus Dormibacteraeota bacterium]
METAQLEAELRRQVKGSVSFEAGERALYAMDGSNYRQVPVGAVVPRTIEDVVATIDVCRSFGAPVFSRGGGTSLAGQCCNAAIVIDWSRHLNQILEINASERFARVRPGVVCDQLRDAAARFGLTWGPDPSTHTHCTFGGMIGNNSCGVHSQMAGKTVENILEMDILLYDGTRMMVGPTSQAELETKIVAGGRVGGIYAQLSTLRIKYEKLIRERYAKIPRRVSGYNLDELLPDADGNFNLARALVGTESTCVTVLEAKVKLVEGQLSRALVVLGFTDIFEAADHTAEVARFGPIGLEGFDAVTTRHILKKGLLQGEYIPLLPEGDGWLLVEFGGSQFEEAEEKARTFLGAFEDRKGVSSRLLLNPQEQRKVWILRESGLGANSYVPGEDPCWEGWEDSAVAPEKLGPYLRELQTLYDKYEYHAALYGHFGHGCVHNRVNFDLGTPTGVKKWRAFMEDATDLCVRYGGSLSGEHGDGQARAEFLPKMFGPELVQAFREFKAIWDPDGKMNPGKVVEPYRIEENLRLSTKPKLTTLETHFAFAEDGGDFAQAVERCVGVGKCRRASGQGEQDTMCPSFMVTREEKHSTRGRAHLLWEMTRGEVLPNAWKSEEVKEALDLCLSCKGCKGDCPVNVDVATYKAEFLSHYWEGRLRPLRAFLFGWIDKLAATAAVAPWLANGIMRTPLVSSLIKKMVGIAKGRTLPAFAPGTFRSAFQKRKSAELERPNVMLWPDTFNDNFRPETLGAAVEVLEAAGYRVTIPQVRLCCGRPLYDHGFLDMAKAYLEKIFEALKEPIARGIPLVVLEPSCCSVFRDEMLNLFPKREDARKLAGLAVTLAEFLEKFAPSFATSKLEREALVQGHCHHKAVMRLKQEKSQMNKLGLRYEVLESGCCGMAGAFGYEADKYDVSIACGERVLLPRVREAAPETLILADGFSCREQIEQATGRKTLHLAETIQMALRVR